MNKALLNTKPNKNSIATSKGWVDYKTKQVLVPIDNLKWRLENEQETEVTPIEEIKEEVINESTENKTKLGTKRNSNKQRLDGPSNE